ncbi:hypothetical protein [Brucella thiophenivorans]|uniref:Uncharacterized protein n=1 Tax=Brucella thiophenivorans TaxID=571255 RepID=A0A256FTL2_9HYPH|nr:hypothetical protein [Brucella thiophenivorans]OYR18215.1 hypothetical protein CEV31_4227 [Brucella thiophenivorans]
MSLCIKSHTRQLTVCIRKDEEGELFAVIFDQFGPDSLFFLSFRQQLEHAFCYEVEISEQVNAHAPEAEQLRLALAEEMRKQGVEYAILHELPQDWEDRA